MTRLLTYVAATFLSLSLCSCSTSDGSSAADRLSFSEKNDLIIHARMFLSKQGKKFRLSPRDIDIVMSTEPLVREFYDGYKQGRLMLTWPIDIPGVKEPDGKPFIEKEVRAVLDGYLTEGKDWHVSIAKKDRVTILEKSAGTPKQPISREEFKLLREK